MDKANFPSGWDNTGMWMEAYNRAEHNPSGPREVLVNDSWWTVVWKLNKADKVHVQPVHPVYANQEFWLPWNAKCLCCGSKADLSEETIRCKSCGAQSWEIETMVVEFVESGSRRRDRERKAQEPVERPVKSWGCLGGLLRLGCGVGGFFLGWKVGTTLLHDVALGVVGGCLGMVILGTIGSCIFSDKD